MFVDSLTDVGSIVKSKEAEEDLGSPKAKRVCFRSIRF